MSIQTAGEWATSLLAILGLVGLVFRFLVLLPLKAYIKEVTYPIQSNANGGKSLPDVAMNVQKIHERLDTLENRLDTLEK